MTNSEFLRALEEALELESGSIAGNELLSELGWWDSLAVLTFMAVADQKLGVIVAGEKVGNCRSLPELLELVGVKSS